MELLRALACMAEPPAEGHGALAAALGLPVTPDAAAYTEVFVLQLPPYASVYTGAEGMLGGEARDRTAGFLRSIGLAPGTEPDHLALLAGTAARLAEREAQAPGAAGRAPLRHARRALLWEHLLPWLPVYLDAAARVAVEPYGQWARLLDRVLRAEAAALGPPPEHLPLHLRDAPGLPDPREAGAEAFLGGLLAPVRAGFVLTRAALRRIARDRGLGLRAGERRFALRALLGQDAAGLLAALATEAGDAARRWSGLGSLGATGTFWQARARAAATLLDALAAEGQPHAGAPLAG